MRVAGYARSVPSLSQVNLIHHWVTKSAGPIEPGNEPPLLARQLARFQPRIAPEPRTGRRA